GISHEGALLDLGVDNGVVRKAGAWYTYEGEQLGQGREKSRAFLKENTDIAEEIDGKIRSAMGIGDKDDAEVTDISKLVAEEAG
ncbi:MAG: recombination protein RecA, partial [Glaciecola sp.]